MGKELSSKDKRIIEIAYSYFSVDAKRKYSEYVKKASEAMYNGDAQAEYYYTKKMALVISSYLPIKERVNLMYKVRLNKPKKIKDVRKDKNRKFSRKILKGLSIEKRLDILKKEYSENPPASPTGKRIAALEINALSYLANQKTIKNEREGYVDRATSEDEVKYRENVDEINKKIDEGNKEIADIENEMRDLTEKMKKLEMQRQMIQNSQKEQREAKLAEDKKIEIARQNAEKDFNTQLSTNKPNFFERAKYFIGEKITKFNIWRKERKLKKTEENQERLKIAIDKEGPQFGEDFYRKVDEQRAAREASKNAKPQEKDKKQL